MPVFDAFGFTWAVAGGFLGLLLLLRPAASVGTPLALPQAALAPSASRALVWVVFLRVELVVGPLVFFVSWLWLRSLALWACSK